MSLHTKVLLVIAAIIAFAIGAILNSVKVETDFPTAALLSAELIEVNAESIDDTQSVAVASKLNTLTLVNFWASWCAPCRQEMPLFEAMYRVNSENGFTVIGIAIDTPDRTQAMLDSMDITYPILYAEATGNQLMESVGNPQGLLPYSLLLNEKGELIDQVLGTIHEPQIVDWLESHLK